MTTTFMSILTDMCQSGLFLLVVAWIIPFNGQGMDHRRMCSLFKIIIDLANCMEEEVSQVFMKCHQYVRGHYFADDNLIQDEQEAFIDLDQQMTTYVCSKNAPFTLVKVECDFGICNRKLGEPYFLYDCQHQFTLFQITMTKESDSSFWKSSRIFQNLLYYSMTTWVIMFLWFIQFLFPQQTSCQQVICLHLLIVQAIFTTSHSTTSEALC